ADVGVDVIARALHRAVRRFGAVRPAALAGAKSCALRRLVRREERSVVTLRTTRRTRRAAIDACRSHAVEKALVGRRIPVENGLPGNGFIYGDILRSEQHSGRSLPDSCSLSL